MIPKDELAEVHLLQAKAEIARLSHQNAMLSLYLRHGLSPSDSITETGEVVSAAPTPTETNG